MDGIHAGECRRYAAIFRQTASGFIERSAEAPPRARAEGHDLKLALPAARVLLREPDQAATEGECASLRRAGAMLAEIGRASRREGRWARFNDSYGFSRASYHPLAWMLQVGATQRLNGNGNADDERIGDEGPGVGSGLGRAVAGVSGGWGGEDGSSRSGGSDRSRAGEGFALDVWRTAIAWRHGDRAGGDEAVGWLLGGRGPLHEQSLDDALDGWTFRELVGLHAAVHLALLAESPAAWLERVASVCDYHQQHTQPDYTTYQPWGIAAFAMRSETAWFAEQQLHDATTQVHVEGGGAGLVPALLLVDAADQLDRLAATLRG